MVLRESVAFVALLVVLISHALVGVASAQDERPADLTSPVPASDPPDATEVEPRDREIEEQLSGVFAVVDRFRDIRVSVRGRVVRLEGKVPTPVARETAETLARGMDGVLFVDSDIEEASAISERLLPSVNVFAKQTRSFIARLPLFVVGIVIVLLFLFLSRLVGRADALFNRAVDNPLIRGVLRQVSRTLVILGGLYLGLEVMGATTLVGGILGTAGVVGLAVGFAFRDIVENYLSSILLSIRKPFRSKDWVEIDGQEGTVIRLTTSDTILMTAEGNHLRIPNATVFKSKILNYTLNPRRRFEFAVGVGVAVDLEAAQGLGLSMLRDMPGVLADPPPACRVEELGDSNVVLRFYVWVDQHAADFAKVRSQAIRLVKSVFDSNGIDMPLPTYRVELARRRSGGAAAEALPRMTTHEIDVSVDRHIEEQVEDDQRHSDEADLLDPNQNKV